MAGNKLGSSKRVANMLGISLDEYLRKVSSGLKYCYGCQKWLSTNLFSIDLSRGDGISSLCKKCKYEKGYTRKKREVEIIKRRAHRAVFMRVLRGKLENPNLINCFDCGHIGNDRRHEYDHYNGYQGDDKFHVQAVCSLCHAKRHKERRNVG
jgi:hypothetical protein